MKNKIVLTIAVVGVAASILAQAASYGVQYQQTDAGNKPEPPSCLMFVSYDSLTTDLETVWAQSPSSDVWGYVAYYSTDGGLTWKDGGYTRAEASGRLAKGIGKNATYTYKVAAFNQFGNSAFIQASWNYGEYAKPGEIEFVTYDEESEELTYSWGDSASDDLECYVCEYSTDGGKTWKEACKVKWNRNSRTATQVKDGTMFRVCAQDCDGFRTPCVVATFRVQPTIKE